MPKIRAVCPECAAVLSLGESAAPGKNVRCPKCQTVFPVPDDAASEPVGSERAAAERERPRRFKPKKQSSQTGVMIAIVAATILLIAGAGVGGYYIFKSKRGTATVQRRPTPTNVQTGLGIDQVAQDIEGEDLDGVRFKLSDYRGKIVLLDFWGHW
jgi:predicted Zn finger-like uncharacterized protein